MCNFFYVKMLRDRDILYLHVKRLIPTSQNDSTWLTLIHHMGKPEDVIVAMVILVKWSKKTQNRIFIKKYNRYQPSPGAYPPI